MKIKIRPRLDAILVAEARTLGLDISRIVKEALIRETAAERIRRQAGQAGNGDLLMPWLTNAYLWNAPIEQSVSKTNTTFQSSRKVT